mgnify:FL=1
MELLEIGPFVLIPGCTSSQTRLSKTHLNCENLFKPSSGLSSVLQETLLNDTKIRQTLLSQKKIPVSLVMSHQSLSEYNLQEILSASLHIEFLKPTFGEKGHELHLQQDFTCDALEGVINDVIKQVEKSVRRGVDLYVKRNDGFRQVYKNNSEMYMQKMKERGKCSKKKWSTPHPVKQKPDRYVRSYEDKQKSQGNTQKQSVTRNLEDVFERAILKDITNSKQFS